MFFYNYVLSSCSVDGTDAVSTDGAPSPPGLYSNCTLSSCECLSVVTCVPDVSCVPNVWPHGRWLPTVVKGVQVKHRGVIVNILRCVRVRRCCWVVGGSRVKTLLLSGLSWLGDPGAPQRPQRPQRPGRSNESAAPRP